MRGAVYAAGVARWCVPHLRYGLTCPVAGVDGVVRSHAGSKARHNVVQAVPGELAHPPALAAGALPQKCDESQTGIAVSPVDGLFSRRLFQEHSAHGFLSVRPSTMKAYYDTTGEAVDNVYHVLNCTVCQAFSGSLLFKYKHATICWMST